MLWYIVAMISGGHNDDSIELSKVYWVKMIIRSPVILFVFVLITRGKIILPVVAAAYLVVNEGSG